MNQFFKLFFIYKNFPWIWGLGIGDWGLGIGDWAQCPIPNAQSQSPIPTSSQKSKENFYI